MKRKRHSVDNDTIRACPKRVRPGGSTGGAQDIYNGNLVRRPPMSSHKRSYGKRERKGHLGTEDNKTMKKKTAKKKSKLTPGQYTVGWICALSTETVPAVLLLDEEHERLPGGRTDGNSYYFGTMGPHNVIIATLPMGTYGLSPAAKVVSDLMSSFPSIRFCLMVGVGAGIPSQAPTMRLGDVVISTPTDHLSGVVQFDMGAEHHDQRFTLKNSLNRPPYYLLSAASLLRTEISLGRNNIPAGITRLQQRSAETQSRFAHPGMDQDRLFQVDYQCESSDSECGSCDMRNLVARPCDRSSTDPVLYFGTIASGNTLMRNPESRDRIGRAYKALCIEMEAAGIMNNLPCLVIRGICDYADSHKNKKWQDYAAMTASVCAREILSHVMAEDVRAERQPLHQLKKVDHRVRTVERTMKQAQQAERILQGLAPTSFQRRHWEYQRQTGGVKWRSVLHDDRFRNWRKEDDQKAAICYWGEPGVGKSCMMSVVVNKLEDDFRQPTHNSGLAYVYCKHGDRSESSNDVITDLVRQLVKQSDPSLMKQSQMKALESNLPEIKLHTICDVFDVVWILVDAVDELAHDPKNLLRVLAQIRQKHRLFITCRKQTRRAFLEVFPQGMEAHLRAGNTDLEDRITRAIRDSELEHLTPEFEKEMTEKIIHRAEGNFLFADSLATFVLAEGRSQIQGRLNRLPITIEDVFTDMIERALSDTLRKHRRKQILTLVAFAERPLTVEELRYALDMAEFLSDGSVGGLSAYEFEDRGWVGSTDLHDRCLDLVIVDESDSTVRFFHRSLHEYLRAPSPEGSRRPIVPSKAVQDWVFQICLGYLELPPVLERSARMAEEGHNPDLGRRAGGLISYAAAYWGHHLRKAGQSKESLIRATDYLSRDFTERYLGQWYLCDALPKHYRPKKLTLSFLLSFSSLHTVSYFGLQALIPRLRKSGNLDINAGDTNNATALHWAAGQGFYSVVKRLVAAHADVEKQDIDNSPPLVWLMDWVGRLADVGNGERDTEAEFRLHQMEATDIANILLERSHYTNMYFRLGGGRELRFETKGRGLPEDPSSANESDISYLVGQYHTLLMRAAGIGLECVTKTLLGRNADMAARNDRGWTALHFAAKGGHLSITRLLLDYGADPNLRDYYGFIPSDVVNQKTAYSVYQILKKAARERGRGSKSSERDLRMYGLISNYRKIDSADVPDMIPDWKDQPVGVAFMVTFSQWDPSTMSTVGFEEDLRDLSAERVKEHLMDPTSRWDCKEAPGVDPPEPVLWAAYHGHMNMVRILLQQGGQVDKTDDKGRTALSWVAQRGSTDILAVLLQHQADVDARDANGRTPLSWAAENGHTKAIKTLLNHGASIETTDKDKRTPLLWAIMRGHLAVVGLILQRSATHQDKDATGMSGLAWAAATGDIATLKFLLGHERYETPLESRDQIGCTPLIWAAAQGHEEAVQILLTAGADLKVRDRNGRTPLLWAAKEGHVGTMKLFQAKGANLQMPDHQQRSPVAWAAGRGHKAAVKYLLKQNVPHLSSDSKGITPLAWAAAGGHVKVIKTLLDHDADPNPLDKDHRTPLMWAARMGRRTTGEVTMAPGAPLVLRSWLGPISPARVSFRSSYEMIHASAIPNMSHPGLQVRSWRSEPNNGEAIRLLLQKGLPIDEPDRKGRTPLSLACEFGDQVAVDLLLDHGANPDAPDDAGRTPLSWATDQRAKLAFPTMLRRVQPDTIHVQDHTGRTPVSWAAGAGNLDAVEALLLKGADVNLADIRGRTPLSWAVEKGSLNIFALLVKAGANVDCIDNEGRALLSWSTASGSKDMVKAVLQHQQYQENPDIKDAIGRTPLSYIGRGVQTGVTCIVQDGTPVEQDVVFRQAWHFDADPKIVPLLVEKGADLNSRDHSNRTPLSWAASQGLAGVVTKMLELGAEVDARDQNGRTPLSWAVETESLDTVEKLLEYGADAESKDYSNQSIFTRSMRQGSRDIVVRLLKVNQSDLETAAGKP